MKRGLLVIGLVCFMLVSVASAQQETAATQSIHGWSPGSWSFLTAWNLSSGAIVVSGNWYSGNFRFEHPVPQWRQWIARFVYNQGLGQTRALAWYYDQPHVQ